MLVYQTHGLQSIDQDAVRLLKAVNHDPAVQTTYLWTRDPHSGRSRSLWFSRGESIPRIPLTHDVYFGVNPALAKGNAYQRATIATLSHVVALYGDFDGWLDLGDLIEHLRDCGVPEPSAAVRSGGGHHCYWILDKAEAIDDNNREALARLQRAWVHTIGADPAATDLARVLRLPGTTNHKPERLGARVELCYLEEAWRYSLDELKRYVTDVQPEPAASEREHSAEEQEIADALAHIPDHLDYEEWLAVLMAVHSLYPDSRGIELCEAWSPGYPGEIAKKFASFQRGGVTIATLFAVAKAHGYVPVKKTVADEDARTYLTQLRSWVESGECSDLLKRKGIARVSTAVSVLLPLVDLGIERGTKRVAASVRELSSQWGINYATISRTLNKLEEIGLMRLDRTGGKTVVDLSFLEVDLDATVLPSMEETVATGSTSLCEEASDFLSRHLGDDAFRSYPYAYAQRRRARAQGETVLMTSLGGTGWLMWKYLEQGGTINELAEASGFTPASVRACVKKYMACGLLEVESIGRQKSYVLKQGAEEHLDSIRPHMVTYNVGQMTTARNNADTADYAAVKLRQLKRDPKATPRDIAWWTNLRSDKDQAAMRIFAYLSEERGFDGDIRVGKEKAVRTRSKYDHGEEWRSWGKALWDEWQALGDAGDDEKLRLLTLAHTTKDTDDRTFRALHADMRERVRIMLMLSRKVGRYALAPGEDYYEAPAPAPSYTQLRFEEMEVIPHG